MYPSTVSQACLHHVVWILGRVSGWCGETLRHCLWKDAIGLGQLHHPPLPGPQNLKKHRWILITKLLASKSCKSLGSERSIFGSKSKGVVISAGRVPRFRWLCDTSGSRLPAEASLHLLTAMQSRAFFLISWFGYNWRILWFDLQQTAYNTKGTSRSLHLSRQEASKISTKYPALADWQTSS